MIFKGFALTRRNRSDESVTSAACLRLLMGLSPLELAPELVPAR